MLFLSSEPRDRRLSRLSYSPHVRHFDGRWLERLLRFADRSVGRSGAESARYCKVRLVQDPKRDPHPKCVEEEQVDPAVMEIVRSGFIL